MAHDYRLYYPYFDEYFDFFDFENTLPERVISPKSMTRFLGKNSVLSFLRYVDFVERKTRLVPFVKSYTQFIDWSPDAENPKRSLNESEIVKSAQNRITILRGWLWEDLENLEKFAPKIRKIFTPKPFYMRQIDFSYEEVVKNYPNEKIIGVHIRRTDYTDFADGKWCFSDETYAEKLIELHQLVLEKFGKNSVFILCSDSKINIAAYQDLNIYYQERHFIIDLYLLAKCDLIIGVPSTFNMWASFYGQVPLLVLSDKNQKIDYSEAQIVQKVGTHL